MSTTLDDLFGPGCDCTGGPLAAAVEAGHVRIQQHPTLPLAIANYSEKAVYERAWTDVTRTCRGLIFDATTGEIIARCLPKFWNAHEPESADLVLDAPAVVFDKLDGSMGLTYPTPDGWAIATRGSFASEQAIRATGMLRTACAGWEPPAGKTAVFEILYPENRIVVDYGATEALVLLAVVDIATGRTAGPDALPDWPGPRAECFPYRTLAEALAAPVRDNCEGFVIWFPESDRRVKLKTETYVQLHKIVTGLSARTVWQHLVDGKPLAELIEPLPDEFRPWVEEVAAGITTAVDTEAARLTAAYDTTINSVRASDSKWQAIDRSGRKDFAMAVQPATNPDAWAMFALVDGRDIRPELLKRARPEPYLTPSGRTFTEENA